MSLTKEECLKALNTLSGVLIETDYVDGRPICSYPIYEEEQAVIYKLVKEHFDNPPLKFDDLEPDMWVWDNKMKRYRRIEDIDPYTGMIPFAHWKLRKF